MSRRARLIQARLTAERTLARSKNTLTSVNRLSLFSLLLATSCYFLFFFFLCFFLLMPTVAVAPRA